MCSKCGNTGKLKINQIRVAGGWLSAIFDLEENIYEARTCTNCGYTELYAKGKGIG